MKSNLMHIVNCNQTYLASELMHEIFTSTILH